MNRHYAFLYDLLGRKDFEDIPLEVYLLQEFPNLTILEATEIIDNWNNDGRPRA